MGLFCRFGNGISAFLVRLEENVADVGRKIKKVGQEDPRRITHSVKVGLALTVVSLLYYCRPLYNGFGQSAMWAILTVVVVFEFTVGGTLSKCLNRGFATFVAGALGIGAEHLASLSGEKGDPIVLGVLVFLLATTSTFIRFFPHIKQRYDYGVLIFILTFSLVTVSGYRVDEIFELAHQRISTILIGAATCIIVSISLRPVWAGEDLHCLIVANIEKLATFLEGFGGRNSSVVVSLDEKYKSVFNTKATEESLANFAWWEPGHGPFRFFHPWKQYLKLGVLIRECACLIETLKAHKYSEAKASAEIQEKIRETSLRMSSEAGKALREIASSIKEMAHQSSFSVETHMRNAKSAMEEVTSVLDTSSLDNTEERLLEIVQVVATVSILVEIIKCVERISESVHELSKQSHFQICTPNHEKKSTLLHRGAVKPFGDGDGDHVFISIHGTADTSQEEGSPPAKVHEASQQNSRTINTNILN